jgi:hypothetical protein
MWSDEIRFRVTGIRVDGSRAVVEALVDGVPGRLVLVSVALDVVSTRVGNYQLNPQLGALLDQLWVR